MAKGRLRLVETAFNDLAALLECNARELQRVSKVVGRDGRMTERASLAQMPGGWGTQLEAVNSLIGDLVRPSTEVARVITAVAEGDLSQKMALEIEGNPMRGEFLRIGMTVNTMVDQLRSFAAEVTRVAREVGTEGKLGGQADVPGVAGTWKALTDSVNSTASNLTTQVRDIAKVVTAVANGDLSKKFVVATKGEIAELADTINAMTDTLRVFADQVTTVAREVGTEGKLGGQAKVPGAAGIWRDLTDNVNQLANNLTGQVRAIADVAQAVTEGDLTRTVTVEAQGEVFALKERVNQMIAHMRETTQRDREQDWLKTNLAKFGSMMQKQKSLESVSRLIMSELTPLVGAAQGAFFIMRGEAPETEGVLRRIASYAFDETSGAASRFHVGEGLVGQCALEKKSILLSKCPADYVRITSGLGEAAPLTLLVFPILFEEELRAVIELASFQPFSNIHRIFLDQLSENIGVVLNTIGANARTEELLKQSQKLTLELQSQSRELQAQQEELKRSNLELAEHAKSLKASEDMLKEQQEELQQVNEELEEKATQLAISSRYKSEFFANMSHELRTPLNSLLILAKLLADNDDGTLSSREVDYAKTILGSGTDLLTLINEVLDLSKVEAGKIEIHRGDVSLAGVCDYLEGTFRPIAAQKNLNLDITLEQDAPASIVTDSLRLQQILRNLIGNAFKFTDHGGVAVRVGIAKKGASYEASTLSSAPFAIAFSVTDTGIGIPSEKQRLIFEAFQQADGTTSRKYGGTGLGLSISRELARLLGGEIHVQSAPGEGSTFSLHLPPVAPEEAAAAAPDSLPEDRESRDSDEARSAAPRGLAPLDGAFATIVSFLDRKVRNLLVVEDDDAWREAIVELLDTDDVAGCSVAGFADATRALEEHRPDCLVLDLGLPGRAGYDVLDRLKGGPTYVHLPAVVYVRHELARRDEARIKRYPKTIVLKEGFPPERLLDETAGFIHRVESNLPLDRQSVVRDTRRTDHLLRGKKVLVIDDDVRNIFALTGLLEASGMSVACAENGRDGIALVEKTPDLQLVLMDVMMPGMDGYETTRAIRGNPAHASLPIIALTAQAMKGDREKCLEAGASDYIAKPVDPDQLLSVMRVWLFA
jgi:signal transduction histidine kinase/DNA-binding response OmpR family regulator/HAMP domain-containing protein